MYNGSYCTFKMWILMCLVNNLHDVDAFLIVSNMLLIFLLKEHWERVHCGGDEMKNLCLIYDAIVHP